jgi:antitoxin VapB
VAQTKAKLFNNGRSQAVRLPAPFRFEGTEVYIRRDPNSGDVILSRKPQDWSDFLALRDINDPDIAEFMTDRVDDAPQKRKLF